MKTVIGIDPGANGGIAIYKNGRLESTVKMPSSLPELKQYFHHVKNIAPDGIIFIEKIQMFMSDSDQENRGKQFRIKKLLSNYDQIKALITFFEFEFVEVFPRSWQSYLGFNFKGIEKTDRKNILKEGAKICYPEHNVTLWNSDAILIMQFGINKLKYDPSWITKYIQNTGTGNLF